MSQGKLLPKILSPNIRNKRHKKEIDMQDGVQQNERLRQSECHTGRGKQRLCRMVPGK